jgi:hypothetical protein
MTASAQDLFSQGFLAGFWIDAAHHDCLALFPDNVVFVFLEPKWACPFASSDDRDICHN